MDSARIGYDRQPGSLHTETISVVTPPVKLHHPPRRSRSLRALRSIAYSPISQDEPQPDAARELAGVDGRLSLLLAGGRPRCTGRGGAPPVSSPLHQQDHQAAQGIFIGRVLLQGCEEQLLGEAKPARLSSRDRPV